MLVDKLVDKRSERLPAPMSNSEREPFRLMALLNPRGPFSSSLLSPRQLRAACEPRLYRQGMRFTSTTKLNKVLGWHLPIGSWALRFSEATSIWLSFRPSFCEQRITSQTSVFRISMKESSPSSSEARTAFAALPTYRRWALLPFQHQPFPALTNSTEAFLMN